MAKIIKTNVQEEALKTINADIKYLTGINTILNLPEKATGYTMTITQGRNNRAAVPVSRDLVDDIFTSMRKKMVNEVKSLSKKHAIVLDDVDMAVLDNVRDDVVPTVIPTVEATENEAEDPAEEEKAEDKDAGADEAEDKDAEAEGGEGTDEQGNGSYWQNGEGY